MDFLCFLIFAFCSGIFLQLLAKAGWIWLSQIDGNALVRWVAC